MDTIVERFIRILESPLAHFGLSVFCRRISRMSGYDLSSKWVQSLVTLATVQYLYFGVRAGGSTAHAAWNRAKR